MSELNMPNQKLSLLIMTSWRLMVKSVGQGLIDSLIPLSLICDDAQRCCHCCSIGNCMTSLMSFGKQICIEMA